MKAHKIEEKLSTSGVSLTNHAPEIKEEKCNVMERKKRVIKKTWKMRMAENKNLTLKGVKAKNVKVKRKAEKTTRKNYTVESVKCALKATQQGLSHRKAASVFGIPEATLRRKIKHPDNIERWRLGTVLTQEEEQELIHWIDQKASSGRPASKKEFMDTVEVFVKNINRKNPFTNGRPGRHWFEGFIRRHPNLNFSTIELNDEKMGKRLHVNNFCAIPPKFELEEVTSVVDPLELVELSDVRPIEFIETSELKNELDQFSEELEADTNPSKDSDTDKVATTQISLVEESESSRKFLEQFEKRLSKDTLEQFQNHEKSDSWSGALELKGLYEFWFNLTST